MGSKLCTLSSFWFSLVPSGELLIGVFCGVCWSFEQTSHSWWPPHRGTAAAAPAGAGGLPTLGGGGERRVWYSRLRRPAAEGPGCEARRRRGRFGSAAGEERRVHRSYSSAPGGRHSAAPPPAAARYLASIPHEPVSGGRGAPAARRLGIVIRVALWKCDVIT